MQDIAIAQEIARVLDDHKALNIVALDVSEMTVVTDYMIIASGRTANQVKALSDYIDEKMRENGLVFNKLEGYSEGRWIIMDYGHTLVELFHTEERAFYNLDRLWDEGTNRLELPFEQE